MSTPPQTSANRSFLEEANGNHVCAYERETSERRDNARRGKSVGDRVEAFADRNENQPYPPPIVAKVRIGRSKCAQTKVGILLHADAHRVDYVSNDRQPYAQPARHRLIVLVNVG
jgi:hypothetical protein